MKNWKLPTPFKTPLGIVLALGLSIILVDILIVSVIQAPPIAKHLSGVYHVIVDAILLTLFISPALYSLVFKKLESDELLQQINASVQEAIIIVNEADCIIGWNPAAQRYFQYTQEEVIGKPLHPLLAPSHYHTDALRGFADFQKTGKGPLVGSTNEVAAIRKDGSEFPVELSLTALKVKGGWHAVGVMRDISERKREKDSLRASEAEFHTLAEAMPQIVWITRADGWNIYFNRQWIEYTGLTLEESYGHGWNKPFHPDDQQQAWDAWQLAVAGRGIYTIESRLRRADGVYRWWLVRGVPVKEANGEILKWFGTCTDIHDLKMAELAISNTNAELRESERRFSDLLGNVELISMMLDCEARITYCNEYLLRLTGWERDEVIGKNWFDICVPPELNYLKDSFFDTLLANLPEAHHHENEILTRSGERLLIHWNNSVLRSVGGDVIGTASIGEDITERNRLALLLDEKETRLRTLVNTIPDLIWLKDVEGVYQSCNPMFERFFGAKETDIVGKSDFDFVDRELAESFRANDRIAMAAHKPSVNEEWVVFADDGHRALLETIKTPMRDAGGKLLGVLGIARDITVRKKLELDREQYFKFFVLSINPMCIADPYGCFTQVNPAFVELTGYSESELIAKPFLDFVLPDDRQRTGDEMKLQVEKRPTLHFDNRYMCKDGSVIDLSWTAYYDKQDGITYATANDVTQFNQAQQALQTSREDLHRLLNSIAEGAYGLDTHGDCTFVNRSFLQMLGYQTEAEVLGKHLHELIHHSHADGSLYPQNECKAYRAYRANQSINVSDEVFWRKDGVAVPVEYWSHPIVSDGVTIGAIVTFIDITERMNAIAAMREKELLLSESQRIAHVGSWRFEFSGQLTWSDETYRIYGVSRDTFKPSAEAFLHLILPADRPAMQEWMSSCAAGNKPGESEFRIFHPDGTERVISGFGELQYDALNSPDHIIGIVHDITERKQTEEKLADQVDELRRWHEVTSGRENRILELKHEVNEMLGQAGRPMRYSSAESQDQLKE